MAVFLNWRAREALHAMPEPIKFSPAVTRLLCAAGVPSSLQGAGLVTRALEELTSAMDRHWPSAGTSEWHCVAEDASRQMAMLVKSGSPGADLLVTMPDDPLAALSVVAKWQTPLVVTENLDRLHALFGRALAVAAAADPAAHAVPSAVAQGFRTLQLAFSGKGKRAAIWDELLETDLLDLELVNKTREAAAATPAAEFLAAVAALLATVPIAPSLIAYAAAGAHQLDTPSAAVEVERRTSQPRGDQGDDSSDVQAGQRDLEPDVRSRLQRADWSSPAEKLGIAHRDHLLTADLAIVTRNLAKSVLHGTRLEQGFAVFAILQLITGCTDDIAAKLEFSPRHSIWLDLERKCWAWDRAKYRDALGPPSGRPRELEPIYIPWPALIDSLVQAGAARSPQPSNLAELICSIQGVAILNLEEFRRFLIRCGNAAHPSYRGRFARSLSNVYLDVTGSDMTAAVATCSFAASAPSALAYYGPRY